MQYTVKKLHHITSRWAVAALRKGVDDFRLFLRRECWRRNKFANDTNIGGDIDALLCEGREWEYEAFYADCGRGAEIQCGCCTHCCDSLGAACEEVN